MALVALSHGPVRAHEVTPAVADLTLHAAGAVELAIDLNAEALIAGIDLADLEDTDLADNAGEYDRLRALSADELTAALRTAWPTLVEGLMLNGAGGAAVLDLTAIEVIPVDDLTLPRTTRVRLSANATAPIQFGWASRYGDLVLRQQGDGLAADAAFTGLLSGGELSPPLTASGGATEGALATFWRYIGVGFDHIIPKGLDHILFVLGLFFLAPRLGPLVWQVSAFTLAHTVTLALGALGIVQVPGSIVEPLIAASIVYVAVENVFTDGLAPWRPVLIFAFGLLHGLGFASVLGEFGLPDSQFIPALVGFNVGVEVGQLAVIAAAFLLVGYWFRDKPWYRKAIAIPASLAIAAVGAYWVVERTLL